MSEQDGYLRIRDEIASGDLMPNERLVEADLSARLGLGRAAVRTTLVRLEQEGLVVREPNRGAKVKRVTIEEASEILEVRARLESLAARHAAERCTDTDAAELRAVLAEMRGLLDDGDLAGVSEANARLHRRLLEISGHTTAQRLCASLSSQTVRHQFRTILAPGRPERSFGEHTAVIDAVAMGDPDAAEDAMRRHLAGVAVALRERATADDSPIKEDA